MAMPRRNLSANDIDYIAGEAARKAPIRWLVLSGALLILLVAAGTALVAESLRERALQAERRSLAHTALLLAKHFDQQIDEFAEAPADALKAIEAASRSDAGAFRGELSRLRVHELLSGVKSRLFAISEVTIFAADGALINSSGAWPGNDINVAERAYFRTLRDGKVPLVIELVQRRLNDTWAIVVARRISTPNGAFLGVVSQSLDPRAVEEFFGSITTAPGASIGLFHADGTLLARYPRADDKIGQNFAFGPIHRELLSKGRSGTRELKSQLSGQVRIAAAQPLEHFPLSIVTTTETAVALAEWRDQTKLLVVVASSTAGLIALTLLLIVRRLSRQNRIARQQLDTALNNITQGLMLYDASSRIVLFNQRYIEMYGLSHSVVRPGRYFRDVMKHRKETGSFEGDPDKFCDEVLALVKRGNLTRRILTSRGGRTIQMLNQPLPGGGWVTTHEDITELKQSEQRIERLAHYDALTRLPNRNLFRETLRQEATSATWDHGLALLYIDVDQFKEINDTLGHEAGDHLLVTVAEKLSACIRDKHFAARLGGDEFAVICRTADKNEIIDFIDQFYVAMRTSTVGGRQLSTGASIGVSLAPAHGSDIDELVRRADLAMYAAKGAGRGSFRFFDAEMEEKVKAERQMAVDLRASLEQETFEIHYQPIVDLRSNAITGCEALLRWTHPLHGPISPAVFIPIAEGTGLIDELGNWVLAKACLEAATWPSHVSLAVNVSPIQFRSSAFGLKVAAALTRSGLPADRLELEITEAVLISDDETTLATLHELRLLGVRIALDDFGIGYSSLSYLQRFPFDKVKIDRSFIRGMADSGASAAIVKAVVMIAAGRDMITTAEGVEEEWQRGELLKLGCDQMQGWLFSPAITAVELRERFADQKWRTYA
jgi:diguanylate cyclase (GGDEF)-like protein